MASQAGSQRAVSATMPWGRPRALRHPAPVLRRELARRFGLRSTLEAGRPRAPGRDRLLPRAHARRTRPERPRRPAAPVRRGVCRAALPATGAVAALNRHRRADRGAAGCAALYRLRRLAGPPWPRRAARGARLVVVSNWDQSLGEVLARVGLAPLLDGVVTSAAGRGAQARPGGSSAGRARARRRSARPRRCTSATASRRTLPARGPPGIAASAESQRDERSRRPGA